MSVTNNPRSFSITLPGDVIAYPILPGATLKPSRPVFINPASSEVAAEVHNPATDSFVGFAHETSVPAGRQGDAAEAVIRVRGLVFLGADVIAGSDTLQWSDPVYVIVDPADPLRQDVYSSDPADGVAFGYFVGRLSRRGQPDQLIVQFGVSGGGSPTAAGAGVARPMPPLNHQGLEYGFVPSSYVRPSDGITIAAGPQWRDSRGAYRTERTIADRDAIPADQLTHGTTVFVSSKNEAFYYDSVTTTWVLLAGIPANKLIAQRWFYDPSLAIPMGWADARTEFAVVDDLADLLDPTILDPKTLDVGKIVYVKNDGYCVQLVAPPTALSGTLSDWLPVRGGLNVYDIEADLPAAGADGMLALVRRDDTGLSLDRVFSFNIVTATWDPLNRHIFTKPTQKTADTEKGMQQGDLQITLDKAHHEVKIFDETTAKWLLIHSDDNIQEWIAASSLFKGTLQEIGGSSVGAQELDALPDLVAAVPPIEFVGHYWTWTGTDGFHVLPATENIGPDLQGAQLFTGDWIQVANRGTELVPDLHYVRVGGNLLTKDRGDALYGLAPWAAAEYEVGAMVTYKGNIFRALNVVPDTAPEPTELVTITRKDPPDQTIDADGDAVFAIGAALGTTAVVHNDVVSAQFGGRALRQGDVLISVGKDVTGIVNPQGWPVINGWVHIPAAKVPLAGEAIDTDIPTPLWEQVIVTPPDDSEPGIHVAVVDTLPDPVGPEVRTGDIFFIKATSTLALYDKPDFRPVLGVPVGTIIAYPSYTPPPGWFLCGGGVIPAKYVALIALVGTTTPDLRTRFIRGAQSEAEIGVKHQDSTKMPTTGMTATTDSSGTHWHGMWDAISGWNRGTSDPNMLSSPGTFGSGANNWAHPHPRTTGGGDHTHNVTITGGGDAETAPIHMTLAYIIFSGVYT
jgi:hypothetical protein